MRESVKVLVISMALAAAMPALGQNALISDRNIENNLMMAMAWKQTAAEFRALYHQGFNIARMRVEIASAQKRDDSLPLAIISDVDETLLLANDYWGYLITQGQDFFDDASWDRWVAQNRAVASPGALEFLNFCVSNGVEVFYVTNRDQGETTVQLAIENLNAVGFPSVDAAHLRVLRESSNKELVQQEIREDYDVVALLGDNLNDFARRYYSTDVEQRMSLMEQDRDRYGRDYILFPNPTDGHWIRAIFGESEPLESDANRRILRDAATRAAWAP
ncbi:MAG: acid phosphatase [SAR86 cluster bacterium]|uniref:Acid phosphatase n=1 Tax=SAR86 cluster bacterium TaxID=2030880 RepID=A0A2A4X8V7_9GAMM|nr:MAG: acid phosphatase [SAR86 cluster bacterium]